MATYSSFSEEAAARASMTPEPGEAAAAPRRRSKGASSPAALELRQRIRAASPFMQSVAPQVLAAMGEASEAGSAQASARRSTARSTARSAALPPGASAPPWKSTSNEDLLPFVCHRCQACTAYHNGVADVIGTSLKVCPWVVNKDRAVRQVNAHFAGYAKNEPEPDERKESAYQQMCRSGFLGADIIG